MPLELYEKYRNANGYINLNDAEKDGLFDVRTLRKEPRGSDRSVGLSPPKAPSSLKGWFDFPSSNGHETFLVRTNMFRNEDENYTDYAELIAAEMAKELDIRSPHYDLFIYNGEHGVLSEKLNKGHESITPLSSSLKHNHQSGVPIAFVDKLLEILLKYQGQNKSEIYKLKEKLRKIVIFQAVTLNEDGHLENIASLFNYKTNTFDLGIYDNEISFLLSSPKNLLKTPHDIKSYAQMSSIVVHGNDSLSPTETVEEIIDSIDIDENQNHDLIKFLCESTQIDMDTIFQKIERKIHAPVPEQAKLIARLAYKTKVRELDKGLILSAYPYYNSKENLRNGEDRI